MSDPIGAVRTKMLTEKFGIKFVRWLLLFTATANWFVFWRAVQGNVDAEWAALLTLGYAFDSGGKLAPVDHGGEALKDSGR